ncbi:MAG: hypothetical protein GKR87_14380 [Kiritimatiellae bacterium]|nr:hypothetical protein [Kiritimatiellia bacterium]
MTLGKGFDYLLDLRETGDYGGLAHVTPKNAIEAIGLFATYSGSRSAGESPIYG